MATTNSINLLILMALFSTTLWKYVESGPKKDDMYELYGHLFTKGFNEGLNYNKEVRPVSDGDDTLFVYLGFEILSLIEVNAKEQTLGTNVRLILSWFDQVLSWEANRFSNISTFMVQQQRVWLPDVIVANSVVKQVQLGYEELPVRLTSTGSVTWEPTIIATTSCSIDVTYYPFDTQKCYIEFETALSQSSEIRINIDKKEPINLNSFSEDGSWELVDTHAENLSNQDSKSKIRFSLLLERRRTFFIVNIIAPVVFLSLTASLVFALPADSGEKMGTGITVLLAYAVYLTIVTDHLPSTSLQVSILALYLTLLLGVTAVSVVTAVFLLRLHHKSDIHPVGPRVIRMSLFLRWITFNQHPGDKWANKTNPNAVKPKDGEDFREADIASLGHVETDNRSEPPHYDERITWSGVASTFDWFLFYLFTTITLCSTLCFILAMSIGPEVDKPVLDKSTPLNITRS